MARRCDATKLLQALDGDGFGDWLHIVQRGNEIHITKEFDRATIAKMQVFKGVIIGLTSVGFTCFYDGVAFDLGNWRDV